MSALTADQLELLQRVRAGLPMWGGSVSTPSLQREVDLLLVLRLIEPGGPWPYRITPIGAHVLEAQPAPIGGLTER